MWHRHNLSKNNNISTMSTRLVVSSLVRSCFFINYQITFDVYDIFYPVIVPADDMFPENAFSTDLTHLTYSAFLTL